LLDDAGLLEAFAESKAMLFPTRYEACSYAILEGIAAGLPVVTTPVGWMRDLLKAVPEYGVFVADRDDSEGLARSLTCALQPTTAALEALEAARTHVAAHNSLAAFGSQWTALIRSLLGENHRDTKS
jgi:glycosyltransferase involved in cell wall biosynthesis